ncbi:hypothetical protein M413DRAFT_64751 [Hebeloma cylindrosporum]|uniref:4'-phosphopantetheinyl transferase domain-containing protein n=1 Tax=Hebeloma cylindrosporum TaxID=76867 RepID=A0A0C3CBS8_HEBCY|nr:hypothetical protein M413DRAFT_64751 [Hebeloma cylindrosporum h7]
MTILGIGVDLVHIPRIVSLLERRNPEKFAAKILSPQEYTQWVSLGSSEPSVRLRFLAVRWNVKEALYKAVYPTLRPTWKEITYHGLTASGQKPSIAYHPVVQENLHKVGRIHVSVSHDGEYSYASVVVEAVKTRDIDSLTKPSNPTN